MYVCMYMYVMLSELFYAGLCAWQLYAVITHVCEQFLNLHVGTGQEIGLEEYFHSDPISILFHNVPMSDVVYDWLAHWCDAGECCLWCVVDQCGTVWRHQRSSAVVRRTIEHVLTSTKAQHQRVVSGRNIYARTAVGTSFPISRILFILQPCVSIKWHVNKYMYREMSK